MQWLCCHPVKVTEMQVPAAPNPLHKWKDCSNGSLAVSERTQLLLEILQIHESAYLLHSCWLFAWGQVFPVMIYTPHLGTQFSLTRGWSPPSLSRKALSPLLISFHQSIFLCFQEEEEKPLFFFHLLCQSCIRIRKKRLVKRISPVVSKSLKYFIVLLGMNFQLKDLWSFIYRRC